MVLLHLFVEAVASYSPYREPLPQTPFQPARFDLFSLMSVRSLALKVGPICFRDPNAKRGPRKVEYEMITDKPMQPSIPYGITDAGIGTRRRGPDSTLPQAFWCIATTS